VPLTIKDILEKTFKRSFKGYDEDEVDRFLDQIIDEFKALQSDNEALKASLAAADERLSRMTETEETIMNTLVSAQKSSERMLAEAARKAELIIDSAQTTARRRAEQTMTELTEAEKRLEEVKAHASQFAESFANMINAQASSFDKAYRSYFGEPEAPSGINTEATRRIGADVEDGLKSIGVIDRADEKQTPGDTSGAEPVEAADGTSSGLPEVPQDELPEAPPDTSGKGFMALNEINQALSELEEQDGDILGDDGADSAFKPRYDDYSWLYDSDGGAKPSEASGKGDDELKTLIDEVIK